MSEEKILVREFPVEFAQVGDGRTVDVRVVPYNTPTEVSDFGGPTYRESWKPGVFDHQTKAANRVWLSFEHEQGLRGVIGHGVELTSRGDGFYGSFRVLDGSDGDKALQMLDKKLLPGVSLEAIPHRSEKTPEGIVERLKATLKAVSLVRFPAFKEAQVLAVREKLTTEQAQAVQQAWAEATENQRDLIPSAAACSANASICAFSSSVQRVSPQDVRDEMAAEEAEKNPPEFSDAELALQRVGFEPLIVRAVTRKPWDGSPSRFEDDEYRRSCLIDRGGDMPVKERCSLPVLEPNGDVNANALGAAAAALSGARGGLRNVSASMKAAAARKLRRYYSQADMEPPASLIALAGR